MPHCVLVKSRFRVYPSRPWYPPPPPPPPHPLAVFPDLCAVPTIWTPRTEASRRKYYICRVQNFFFKNSWFHWCEVFTAIQLVFTDLALIFWASFAGHLKTVPQISFSYSIKLLMQSKLLQKPTSDFSWLLTPLGYQNRLISEQSRYNT